MKIIFHIPSLLWLLYWSAPVSAQQLFSFEQPIVINDNMGLPSNEINAVVKDQTGFIWIGTNDGLVRLDGQRLNVFQYSRNDPASIPNNNIESLLVDHHNRLWVGTTGGLVYYRSESGDFAHLDPEIYPYLNERILSIYQDDQLAFWIGTPTKLIRFDVQNDSIAEFHFSTSFLDTSFDNARINSINKITQDKANPDILWLGSLSGLIKFDRITHGYRWFPNVMINKDRQYLANSVRNLHSLADGNLLVGSWNGAYLFTPQTAAFKPIDGPNKQDAKLFRSSVISFLEVPENDQIGITFGNGFCWFNPNNQQIDSIFYNNNITEAVYSAQIIDAQKRVWGMSNRGVYLYNPLVNKIRQYIFPFKNQLQHILPRAIVSSQKGSKLYLAALYFNGLISWHTQNNQWTIIPPPLGESWEAGVQDIIRLKNGRVIIIGHHKLFELLEEQEKIVPLFPEIDFDSPAFRKAVEGAPNELWIGSRRAGLYRLDLSSGRLKIYSSTLDKFPGDNRHRWIETIYKDSRGQIWIRTAFEYSVYLPKQDTFYHWNSYGRDTSDNFPLVTAFQEDKNGNMWMAGEQFGLGMASVDQVDKGIIKIVTSQDGLPLQNIVNLGIDHQDYLWLENEGGITRYHPETGQIRYFNSRYGIPKTVNEFITPLANGQMILSIADGFALFSPEDLIHNEELPVPYLTSFKVFDREQKELGLAEALKEINLSYKQNFFSFEFSALAFNLPEQVRFRYRLTDFDQQWNESGNRRYAAYTNIPGGDYIFELEAANNEGIWNRDTLQVPIHITTPWWKALWFWFPSGSLAFLAVTFAVRWRIQQVRQQEKIKSEFDKKLVGMELHALRAQMNPHFIFNCLNSIDYYIIKNETEKASDYLNRFSRLIRLILQNSRAEYVNLKDELEALKLYMEMESLRFDDRFEYVVRVGSGLPLESLEIPPLLLQPYVENAIWHGLAKKSDGKNRLDLTITRQDNLLHCRIEDNGIGREAARQIKSAATGKHRSMGMYLTRERLHLINRMHNVKADVKITDLKDEQGEAQGTRVDIIVPIR